jgi:hypothetical protein
VVIRPLDKRRPRASLFIAATWAFVIGCGPPLSEPASFTITGRWKSADRVGAISDIVLDVTQQPDGVLTGHWSANATPNGVCPPDIGTSPSGPATGHNTVVEVQVALMGVGDFHGQRIDDATIRGNLDSCQAHFPVSFSSVGPTPAG